MDLGEVEIFLPGKDIEDQKRKNFEPVFDAIDDLVWLMKRSSYIKNTILGMAVKLYMENKEIVTKELWKILPGTFFFFVMGKYGNLTSGLL